MCGTLRDKADNLVNNIRAGTGSLCNLSRIKQYASPAVDQRGAHIGAAYIKRDDVNRITLHKLSGTGKRSETGFYADFRHCLHGDWSCSAETVFQDFVDDARVSFQVEEFRLNGREEAVKILH